MHGIRPVGKTEIDDRRSTGIVSRIGPKEIGRVQIVVCPKRRKRGQQRAQLQLIRSE